jgi:hypothetical protein
VRHRRWHICIADDESDIAGHEMRIEDSGFDVKDERLMPNLSTMTSKMARLMSRLLDAIPHMPPMMLQIELNPRA